jgi:hypothetical protein
MKKGHRWIVRDGDEKDLKQFYLSEGLFLVRGEG